MSIAAHRGIVTHYNHLRFRSRLEARWAAMFDLLGWKYEYEPYDLPGWIPDFVLLGHDEILVEVKPFTKLEEFDTAKINNAMERGGKHDKEVLLLGCTIFETIWYDAACHIGWLGATEAVLTYDRHGKFGFFTPYADWVDRIANGDRDDVIDFPAAAMLWRAAANAVQWRPNP